jgi:hypothetical protein
VFIFGTYTSRCDQAINMEKRLETAIEKVS